MPLRLAPSSPEPVSDVLVEVRNLVKEYAVTAGAILQRKLGSVKAVSDVSFQIRRGRTFGLVGESGCGKTTIGRLVVALERPTGGGVRFEGEDLATLGRGRTSSAPARPPADVPRPLRVARPPHARRRHH